MWTGDLVLDLLLDHADSLKDKRAVVRPLVRDLHQRYGVAAAESGHLDLWRRAEVGVAVVGADAAHCVAVLDTVERHVAALPELVLLAAHRRLHGPHDDGDDAPADGSGSGVRHSRPSVLEGDD